MISKLSSIQEASSIASNSATKGLVGNYSQREMTGTPMRTPSYHESVVREAQNIKRLHSRQTPMMGSKHYEDIGDIESIGNKSLRGAASTPNAL